MKIKKYSPKIIFGLEEFMKIGVTFENFNGVLNGYTKSEVTDDNKVITEKDLVDLNTAVEEINKKVEQDESFPEFKIY